MATGQKQIKVTIAAVDKVTATVLKINESMNRLFKPAGLTKFNQGMKQLGSALQQNPIVKVLGNIAGVALNVGKYLASATLRLAEFAGVGSLAAITAAVVEWGKLGFQVETTANLLGSSGEQLMQWRAAGRHFGISADAMTSSLKSMGDTLEDAVYGRNPLAMAALNQLGIRLHRTATGAVDTKREMLDLVDVLNRPEWKGNRQAQNLMARVLGAESVMPMILAGPEKVAAAQRMDQLTGAAPSEEQIQRASKFGESIINAEGAVRGLGYTIGDKLVPVLQPLLDGFTQWEAFNKDAVASRVAAVVGGIADAFDRVSTAIGKMTSEWSRAPSIFRRFESLENLGPMLPSGPIPFDAIPLLAHGARVAREAIEGPDESPGPIPARGFPGPTARPSGPAGGGDKTPLVIEVNNLPPGARIDVKPSSVWDTYVHQAMTGSGY